MGDTSSTSTRSAGEAFKDAWSSLREGASTAFSSFTNWMESTKVGSKIVEYARNVKSKVSEFVNGNSEQKTIEDMNYEQLSAYTAVDFYSEELMTKYDEISTLQSEADAMADDDSRKDVKLKVIEAKQNEFSEAAKNELHDGIDNMSFKDIMTYAETAAESDESYVNKIQAVKETQAVYDKETNGTAKTQQGHSLDAYKDALSIKVKADIENSLYRGSADALLNIDNEGSEDNVEVEM